MRHPLLFAALILSAAPLAARTPAAPVVVMLGAPDRPVTDVALDAGRKPVEVIAFTGVKAGDTVLDVVPGGGYYSRLLAAAVGPKGRVVGLMPPPFLESDKAKARWAELTKAHPNLELLAAMPADAVLPPRIDVTLFHLTYHDMYWQSEEYKIPRMEPAAFLTRLYAATKPGGTVLVIDHAANAGAEPRSEAERAHRIDPAVVKADFARAGFRLDAESPMLAMPSDDRSKLVFDPAVRGKTDRFVLRFRKPAR